MSSDDALLNIIDASIDLELNIGKLYELYCELFPEHKEFWWKIALEEENHAALIRSVKEHFRPMGETPEALFLTESCALDDIQKVSNSITNLIENYRKKTPTIEEAFSFAYNLEKSAAELHFQEFMNKDNADLEPIEQVFQSLNQADKNHALRISRYIKEHNIPFHPQEA